MKLSYLALSEIPSKKANSVHVMKMCQALANEGVEVELVVPRYGASSIDPYEFYGVNNVFSINRRRFFRNRLGLWLYSLMTPRVLQKDTNQVVYGRDLLSCYFASLFGFKTIWESHSPVTYMGSLQSRLFRRMVSRDNYVKTVVISSTLKQYYIDKYNIPSDDIVVLPDCSDEVDLYKIVPKEIKRDGYKACVGYIGQLYPGKGMEIISKLVALCPGIDFHIVGGNEIDVDYWKNKLKPYNNVVFHGFIAPSETPSYGLAMDILIAPYLNKVQGAGAKNFKQDISMWMSPLKIFEYMSYRKPIISSDLPVLHDVLNKENSVLCSPDDIASWTRAINMLISNPEEANRIANNAYSDFMSNYTWRKRAEKICKMYKK